MTAHKKECCLNELLDNLRENEVLTDEQSRQIMTHTIQEELGQETPWFSKVLATIGAWTAALFFILFLAIADLITFRSPYGLLAWGVILVGGAVALRLIEQIIFVTQFALALSVAGHGLLLAGSSELWDSEGVFWMSAAAALVLYPLYKDSLHRFLSCLLAITCAVVVIMDAKQFFWLHMVTLLLVVGIIILLRGKWYTTTWRPLLYSLLFSLPVLFLLVLVPKQELDTPWIISNVIITIALLLMYWWMFTENPTWKASQNTIIAIITAIILLGFLSTPGLLISIGLLVLGYRLQEKLTLTIGIAFFPVYIIVFYYNVNMPLYLKSWLLAGTGAVLLLLRYGLLRRPGIKEES